MGKTNIWLIIGLLVLSPLAFYFWQRQKIMNAKDAKEKFYAYDDLFKHFAKTFPWKWLKAIAKQESDLGQNSRVKNGEVSYDGLSWGLMQIAENVGSPKEIQIKGQGGPEKLNDPVYSIQKASQLVSYLNQKYGGNARKVFLAYNQGEINTDRGKDYTVNYNNGRSYADLIFKHLDWIERKEMEYESS